MIENRKKLGEFEELLKDGYLVLRIIDSSENDKSTIYLWQQSKDNRIKLITSDKKTIEKAKEQYQYQNESIGTHIHAICTVIGVKSNDPIKDLISDLDGLWDWKIKLKNDTGIFEVDIRIDSTEKKDALMVIEDLQELLDYIGAKRKIGFYIRHYSFNPIRRLGLHTYFGELEEFIKPLTFDEIDFIKNKKLSVEVITAAQGLNKSYIEIQPSGRLIRLWSAIENIFSDEGNRMLTKDELYSITGFIEGIESLKKVDVKDTRIDTIKSVLYNIRSESRNRRIANNVTPYVSISKDEAYEKVKDCWELRGKHAHSLSEEDWKKLNESNKFLEGILLKYFNEKINK